MISEQLKKIKKESSTIVDKKKDGVTFIEDGDLETETLIDLIPIKSKYTNPASLHFDRNRLNWRQERRFDLKFSQFMYSLINYVKTPDIEYLYEYLVRKYNADEQNRKEFTFILLLDPKHCQNVKKIGKNYFYDWDGNNETIISYTSIAEACIDRKDFFDFYSDYYKYYHLDYVKEFVNEVTPLIVQKLNTNILRYVTLFYDIVCVLNSVGFREDGILIYNSLKTCIGTNAEEFIKVLGIKYEKDDNKNQIVSVPQVLENLSLEDKFKKAQNNSDGRQFLQDVEVLRTYIDYLKANQLNDTSFSHAEIYILSKEDFNPTYFKVESFVNLLTDLEDQSIILCKLLSYSDEELDKIYCLLNKNNWYTIIKHRPESYKNFIDASNYKEIEKIIYSLDEIEDQFFHMHFAYYCVEREFFDLQYFEDIDLEHDITDMLEYCFHENDDRLRIKGFLHFAKHKNIYLNKWLFEKEMYTNKTIFEYIAKEVKLAFESKGTYDKFLYELPESKFEELFKLHKNFSGLSSILRLADATKSPKLINKVVKFINKHQYNYQETFDFVYNNITLIKNENIGSVLFLNSYNMKLFNIIEAVSIKKNVSVENSDNSSQSNSVYTFNKDYMSSFLTFSKYDVIYKLAAKYGFSTILDCLDSNKKENVCVRLYQDGIEEPEKMIEFLLYISNILTVKSKALFKILYKNYDYLMFLRDSTKWPFVKAIVLEGLKEANAEDIFITFIQNLNKLHQDCDLLEKICDYKINLEREIKTDDGLIIVKDLVFNAIKSTPNANILDILINKLGYVDIRVVPFMTEKLIQSKKPSIKILFESFGNVMVPYFDQVLTDYPEAYYSLFVLDPSIITSKIIEYCEKKQTISEYSNSVLSNLLYKYNLSDFEYNSLMLLLIKYINTMETMMLPLSTLISKYKDVEIMKLIDVLFEQNYDKFLKYSVEGIKYNTVEYSKYLEKIIKGNHFKEEEYNFIGSYLKYLPRDSVFPEIIIEKFDTFLSDYIKDSNEYLSKTVGYSFKVIKEKTVYLKKVLKLLREPNTVSVLKLLQAIFKYGGDLKKHINLLTPHISLLIDSTKIEISNECQNLLNVIEKKYNLNPLIN